MKNERRKYRKYGGILIFAVAILFLFCLIISAQAADMGVIHSGETRSGSITGSSYMDSWTFEGSEGDRIIVSAVKTSGDLDTVIYLYPPGGGPAEADTSPWYDRLDHQLEGSGLYTIIIQDYGLDHTGDYQLTLIKLPGSLTSAEDPDGGEIAPGETLSGTINVPSDIDGFQFYGSEGDRIIVSAVKTSGDLDTVIYLYPPGGGPAEADTSPWYDRLDHHLESSGLYTIIIQDYGLDHTGDYQLTLIKLPGSLTSAEDPDGDEIAPGETLSGTINVPSDIDGFQFYGSEGDRIIVSAVKTSGDLDTVIYLYPPGGGPAEADTSPWYDRLDHQLEGSGLYTIIIQDYELDHTGDYQLTLIKLPGSLTSAEDPDGGEIAPGETLSGTINVPSDIDGFHFYGSEGDRIIVSAVKTSGDLDTVICLYPPGGGSAEADTSPWYDRLDHQLESSGLYTIIIHDYQTDDAGEYELALVKIPATIRHGIYNPFPVNGATITNLNHSFRWDAVAGATGYDLYFGEDVIIPLENVGENLSSPEMPFSEMEWDKVYYWHVEAHISNGTIQGPYWWFKTEAIYQLSIANFTYYPLQPIVNETITFDASSSYDPKGGNITKYEWDFGDGNITNTTEPIITHFYAFAQDYIVNLTVTDDSKSENFTTRIITVRPRLSKPTNVDVMIRSGETKMGNIITEGQTDYFTFYGDAGQRVVIEMAAIGGDLGPAVYLYRPNGSLEMKIVGGYYANRVRIENHQLEETGIYTIVAAASWTGATATTGKYGLSLMLIPGATSSDQDPDGGYIASGQTYNCTIGPQSDTDAFVFYGEGGQGIVIEMAAIGGDLGPAIYLYRPNGSLEMKIVGGYYANRVRIENHQLEETGIYTIVAAASWTGATATTGKYGLSFVKIPSTPSPGIYNPFPPNGVTITNLNQSFRWDALTDATGYDLYFGEDITTPLEKVGENLSSPEMPFPVMDWDKVYYWHVEAHIPNGTIQGPYWWFKVVSEQINPKSDIHVYKNELLYLSISDAHINHSEIYNFTTIWAADMWEMKNLDKVTYTITTPKNLTYIDNWELYQNGTDKSFILPPTIEGEN